MGYSPLRTDAMTRVGLVVPHVRTGLIHAKIDTPLVDDELRGLPVESGIVGHVLGLSVELIIVGRVEEDRISRADIGIPFFQLIFNLGSTEQGFPRNVTDIQANSGGDTVRKGNPIHWWRIRVCGEMAHRIDVGWPVITQENAPCLIQKPRSQLSAYLIVGRVGPDNYFNVAGYTDIPM